MIKFKKDFLWGGAMAAEQVEGHGITKKGRTIWDDFYGKFPELFFDKVGPDITNDYTNRYDSDAILFKEIGANSVRIGISWARLYPDGENLNKEAVVLYHNIIDANKKNGLEVVITLFHFDMPLWAHNAGSWSNKGVINKFVKYCGFVFKEYASKVKYFVTFNEPNVPVWAGYQGDAHWPRIIDNDRAVSEMFGIILAHAKVVILFKELKIHSQIGVVINVNPAYPKDNITYSSEDEQASEYYNLIHNYAVLDPMVKGTFPNGLKGLLKSLGIKLDILQKDLDEIAKVSLDFLGINYYAPRRVQKPLNKLVSIPSQLFSEYSWPEARMNVFRGWEIFPQGLYDTAMLVKERYNNIPFFVSENGMGVENENRFRNTQGEIQDDYRIAFLKEHLDYLNKAMIEGSNCFGYHMWAITDNWSWRNAYKNRYGFIEVDLKDQSRKIKKSGRWLKELATKGYFDKNYKKVDEVIDLKSQKYNKSV